MERGGERRRVSSLESGKKGAWSREDSGTLVLYEKQPKSSRDGAFGGSTPTIRELKEELKRYVCASSIVSRAVGFARVLQEGVFSMFFVHPRAGVELHPPQSMPAQRNTSLSACSKAEKTSMDITCPLPHSRAPAAKSLWILLYGYALCVGLICGDVCEI